MGFYNNKQQQNFKERKYGPDFAAGFDEHFDNSSYAHGDIELKALSQIKNKFENSEILNIYFGNWLRDYSQFICGNFISLSLSQESWCKVIGLLALYEFVIDKPKNFQSLSNIHTNLESYFDEFKNNFPSLLLFNNNEVILANDALNIIGIYRPEEHIDNPKYLKDESELKNTNNKTVQFTNFQQEQIYLYDGEDKHTSDFVVNSDGIKQYIENSKKFVKSQLEFSINSLKKNSKLSLLAFGSALHVIEDYFAHSNFIEISIIKNTNLEVYPWVETILYQNNSYNINNPDFKNLSSEEIYDKYFIFKFISEYETYNKIISKFTIKGKLNKDKLRGFVIAGAIPITTGYFAILDVVSSLLPKIAKHLFSVKEEDIKFYNLKENEYTFADILTITILDGIENKYLSDKYKELVKKRNKFSVECQKAKKDNVKNYYCSALEFILTSINSIRNTIIPLFNLPVNLALNISDNIIGDIQTLTNSDYGTNPSHTQIAKDERDHPLNQLAGQLAVEAVKQLGEIYQKCKLDDSNLTFLLEEADKILSHPIKSTWQDKIVNEWLEKAENKLKIQRIQYSTDIEWVYEKTKDGFTDIIEDLENKVNSLLEKNQKSDNKNQNLQISNQNLKQQIENLEKKLTNKINELKKSNELNNRNSNDLNNKNKEITKLKKELNEFKEFEYIKDLWEKCKKEIENFDIKLY